MKKMEAQIQQAQKMEAIGTLAGGIAHDFNNLLMGIQGRASLMLIDTDSYHPHYEHLKGIEDYVKSAADLTKQLLGLARGGKYEVKPTDLNELVNRNAEMFGRTKKEITIHRKNQKDIWTVEVDRSQIEQVMLNLYVNAWQSMLSGGELYLATENVVLDPDHVKPFNVTSGKHVKVSITDTGVGMDKATQEKIFDPFFTTKEMGRGTGLGLASTYGIIKNHSGFINVSSEKGEGTTFNIYLPVSGKDVIEEKKLSEEVLKGQELVLLVDDEDFLDLIVIVDDICKTVNRIAEKCLAQRRFAMNIKTDTPIFKTPKKSRFAVIFAVIFILLGVLLVFLEVRGEQNPFRIGAYVVLLLGACYWIFPVKTSSQVIIRQLISLFLLGALFASCLFSLLTIMGKGHELGAPQQVILIVKILAIVFTILALIGGIIVGVRIYKKIFK